MKDCKITGCELTEIDLKIGFVLETGKYYFVIKCFSKQLLFRELSKR